LIAWWSERTKELVEVLWTSSISHWSIGDCAKLLIAGVEWTKLRGLSGGLVPSISRHSWRPPLTAFLRRRSVLSHQCVVRGCNEERHDPCAGSCLSMISRRRCASRNAVGGISCGCFLARLDRPESFYRLGAWRSIFCSGHV
jgi:hypothetical protein